MIINKIDELALAIVASSSPDLSVNDKINLFVEAKTAINEYNAPIIAEKRKQNAESSEVTRKALGNFYGR